MHISRPFFVASIRAGGCCQQLTPCANRNTDFSSLGLLEEMLQTLTVLLPLDGSRVGACALESAATAGQSMDTLSLEPL